MQRNMVNIQDRLLLQIQQQRPPFKRILPIQVVHNKKRSKDPLLPNKIKRIHHRMQHMRHLQWHPIRNHNKNESIFLSKKCIIESKQKISIKLFALKEKHISLIKKSFEQIQQNKSNLEISFISEILVKKIIFE